MATERLYDSLTEEDHDVFGYYATIAYEILRIRFGTWRRHFEKSKQSLEDARIRAWAEYRETMESARIPVEKISGFESPGNPASKVRGMMISQIFNEILSPHLQGDEYFEACRKISSIMSVRTWIERKHKQAQQEMFEKLRREGAIAPKLARPHESMHERRERYLRIARSGIGSQHEIHLVGAERAVTETPVTTLPTQTTVTSQFPNSTEVTLLMPEIDAEAHFEQKRLSAGGYTPPHGCFKKRHKKVHRHRQAQTI
jgi:hypothetical protein